MILWNPFAQSMLLHLMILLSEIQPDTGVPTIYQRAGQQDNKHKELGGYYQLLLAPTMLQ
jgi:hypothetical protein